MATELEPIKLWQSRVAMARKWQNQKGDVAGRWGKNKRALAGDFNSRAELGEEAIDVNLMRTTVKTSLTQFWVTDPHVTIEPTMKTFNGTDNVYRSEVTEIEVNYWIRELEIRKEVRKALLDSEATNLGYIYVGFVSDRSDVEVDGDRIENNPLVQHKRPFAFRVGPQQVLVPPGYSDLEDCPWVDIVFRMPLRHVKSKWPETTEELEATESIAELSGSGPGVMRDYLASDDASTVDVHNVWDKESKKVYIFATNHEPFLEEPKAWPYEVEGFPLAWIRREEIPDEFYGTPPMSYSLPQNKELNALRTALRKRMNRTKKVIFCGADVGPEAAEKYANATDGEVVSLSTIDPGEDVRRMFMPVDEESVNNSHLAYDALVKSDLRESEGLSAEQRGSGDPNVDSATASANIQQAVNVRQSDVGDRVKSLYLQVAKKLWMILKQKGNIEIRRAILGPTRELVREVAFTREDLRGQFQFTMDIGAVLAQSPSNRVRQAILNYNMMRSDPNVNPDKLLMDIFQAQSKQNMEEYLMKLKAPEEEHALMMQGLPVEAHQRDAHEEHLSAHLAHSDVLDELLDQRPDLRSKVALAQSLLIAHIQHHVKIVQELTGQNLKQAGSPIAENLMRNEMRQRPGGETEAELSGQPLSDEGLIQ